MSRCSLFMVEHTHTGFSIDNVEKIDINAYDGYMP